jgi:Tol biopolymer transport system component
MRLTAGARLGPYEVVAPLGAGGMGEVYKARDTRLDRTVALKILAPDAAGDESFRARFEREARAISALNHPHICALHDIGAHEAVDFLVLEHLEGETLAEKIAREPRGLKLAEALRIAVAVADALDAAHRHGFVHRDLKPGNVMLTPGGPKLLDFGLAKRHRGASGAALSMLATQPDMGTAQGVIVGTLQYMAPEQIQGHDADVRTDIFALGALIYEMVTGHKAFEGQTQASVIAKILEVDPPALSALAPVAPLALERLVQRCLAKSPDDRWQSARDVLLELRSIQEERAKPIARAASTTARPWLPWSIAAAAVIGGISGWLLRPAAPIDPRPMARFDVPLPPGLSPLTNAQGAPALSPDGRHLVVASGHEGKWQLFVRRMDDASFAPLAGTEDGRWPFWSPDSRSIGFFTGAKLRRVDASGGRTATICDVDDVPAGGTWSPTGIILFAAGGRIWRVDQAGGSATPITAPDAARGETTHRFPSFLPDGRSFLYAVLGRTPGVRAASLDGSTREFFLRDADHATFVAPASLVFVREQSVVAVPFDADRLEITGPERTVAGTILAGVSASANGVLSFVPAGGWSRQLQWYGRDGRRAETIGSPGQFQALALSPSGTRVALQLGEFSTTINRVDLWMLELGSGVMSRLTSDPALDGDPAWAPDERRLAFTAQRDGRSQVYLKDLSTGAEEQFLDLPYAVVVDEWTPDGRFIIFRSLGRAIHAAPVNGDRTPRIVADTPTIIEDQSHVSPDGRWIAFNSNESGRWEVYVAGFPDVVGKRQVSSGGGVQPLWRQDGRELFFLDQQGMLMAVLGGRSGAASFGVPRPLFKTPLNPSAHVSEYAVAPDGQRFLVLEPVGHAPPAFTFLLNWRADGAERKQ